jgi:hypothetical protein
MKTKRANLYTETGEPKRIRCYMFKRDSRPVDYITVVFTHINFAGYPLGTVLYRAMSGKPFHPLGYCQWGEGKSYSFHAGGSIVKFSELPIDCQEVIRNDYKDIWESEV